MESITQKGEDCILMGDLNRPMDKQTEFQKTSIMRAWIDSEKVLMLNDPKVQTRIDPVTGRGCTLDLAFINPSLKSKARRQGIKRTET